MRDDFDKVLSERVRSDSDPRASKGARRKLQKDLASGEETKGERMRPKSFWGSSRHYGMGGPTYGYLLKQVGRPWDDVYSEICAALPDTDVPGRETREIFLRAVERDIVMVDGEPRISQDCGKLMSLYGKVYFFYVHPGTGLLCKGREEARKSRRSTRRDIVVSSEDKLLQYHLIEGVWYALALTPCETSSWRFSLYDLGYKEMLSYNARRKLFGGNLLTASKRQLNGKEIKRLGLKNS